MVELDGEPEHWAEAAADAVRLQERERYRKRTPAFGAREALIALQFEATLVHVVSAIMRTGSPLSDEDHARLVVACGRINLIVDEAIG